MKLQNYCINEREMEVKILLKTKCVTLSGRRAKDITKLHHTTQGQYYPAS